MRSTSTPPNFSTTLQLPKLGDEHRSTWRCNPAALRVAWERTHSGVDADAHAVDWELARLAKQVPAEGEVFISGIFDSLASAGLLNTPNLAQLTEVLCADSGRLESLYRELDDLAVLQKISRPDGRAFELRLLTQRNFEDRLQGGADRSHTCQARVDGVGMEDGKVDIKQQRWATWCRAGEAWVERRWGEGALLTEIIRDVAAIRHRIAEVNKTDDAPEFGRFKTFDDVQLIIDFYGPGEESGSTIDHRMWPALKRLANDCRSQYLFQNGRGMASYFRYYYDHFLCRFETKFGDFVARHTFHVARKTSDYLECAMHEFHGLQSEAEEQAFHAGFAYTVGSTQESLRKLTTGDHSTDNEMIQLLGGFAYDMTDLYPFRRGGGAIMQICIRGLMRACGLPCPAQLNDMRLSVWVEDDEYEYKVPLDVVAQFMPANREKYVELFTESILREICAATPTTMDLIPGTIQV